MKVVPYVPALSAVFAMASCSVAFDVAPRPGADGGFEGGTSPDGGTATCASTGAEFCADFEEGSVENGWDVKREEHGAVVTLDTGRGAASARSATFRPTQIGITQQSIGSLAKSFDGARAFTVEFDAWVATPNWGNTVNFAILTVEVLPKAGSEISTFAFTLAKSDLVLTVQVPDLIEAKSPSAFPYERWVHVVFDLDWNARSASIRLDGEETLFKKFTPRSGETGSGAKTNLEVGFFGFNPPPPTVTVNLDNLSVVRR